MLRAAREMMRNLPHIRLVENGWQTWPQFRDHRGAYASAAAAELHRKLQHGDRRRSGRRRLPSVVSDAIDWAPPCPGSRAPDDIR